MWTPLAFGYDHAGFTLAHTLMHECKALNVYPIDLGPTSGTESIDYPDVCKKVIDHMVDERVNTGVLICGTGIGMCMAANRHGSMRAALCHHEYEARMARLHNNANILCLGSRVLGADIALACLRVFLHTSFEGGRHQRRLDKIHTP